MISHADRFGATWWGRLWINGLEKLGDDYENRLPRGKKYAEDGHVSHFGVQPGEIQARVHGRKTYNVTLGLPALTSAQWQKALDRIAQGETSLTVLAHDLGFADHAHLTRTVRAVTGRTPTTCRGMLAG